MVMAMAWNRKLFCLFVDRSLLGRGLFFFSGGLFKDFLLFFFHKVYIIRCHNILLVCVMWMGQYLLACLHFFIVTSYNIVIIVRFK